MFTLQTSFNPNFAQWGGGGGGSKSLVEVTVNSKEENSDDFSPSYVQESASRQLLVHLMLRNEQYLLVYFTNAFQQVPLFH
jgi:hypothetical protein